jgi:hypothetical protein
MSEPTTEAGRALMADLWGSEPEEVIAAQTTQEQWWTSAICAIEAEAAKKERERLRGLTFDLDTLAGQTIRVLDADLLSEESHD